MSGNLENFKAWYASILEGLYGKRDAGIVIFMISLPLLERYLRRKHNLASEERLNEDAMVGLCTLFPALRETDLGRAFWNVYRNGFLHQATLSMSARGGASLPIGWLTHDISEPIQIRPDGSFAVHPERFAKSVLEIIVRDFATFEAGDPPLPVEAHLDPVTIPSTFLGTGIPRS